MNRISTRVESLSPSQTLAMSQKSAELKAAGVDVINLSVGEPDFNTPAHIKEAAKRAIDDNFTFYTPVPGYMSLRKAIADNLKATDGVDFAPEQIVVSNGAKQALCNAVLALVNPGDEVIIPTPAWVSYVEMVKLAEGTNVLVPAGIEQDFKITPAQLEAAITPRTRLMILCSPSNPTRQRVFSSGTSGTRRCDQPSPADHCHRRRDLSAHQFHLSSFTSLSAFPEIADRTVVINGVSKAYAMTGWRIGFIAAPSP